MKKYATICWISDCWTEVLCMEFNVFILLLIKLVIVIIISNCIRQTCKPNRQNYLKLLESCVLDLFLTRTKWVDEWV